jgi:hypothetical protein
MIKTIRVIAAGEELTINYNGDWMIEGGCGLMLSEGPYYGIGVLGANLYSIQNPQNVKASRHSLQCAGCRNQNQNLNLSIDHPHRSNR